MKSNTCFRFSILLTAYLALNVFGSAWAEEYTNLIYQAKEQMHIGQYKEGLATAKAAVVANPAGCLGYYFVALALFRTGQYEEANAAVTNSLKLAPEFYKSDIEQLAGAINAKRQEVFVNAAEAALADSLTGKSARLYEQAWNAGHDKPELGLKAADLYANKLSQPVDAARVLRQVSSAAKGKLAADQADKELTKLAGTLRKIAEENVKTAYTKKGAELYKCLQLAQDTDPSYLKIYEVHAWLGAEYERTEELEKAIKEWLKNGGDLAVLIPKLPKLDSWMAKPEFQSFLKDATGKELKKGEIKCEKCKGEGVIISYTDCSDCLGDGHFECRRCYGTGKRVVPWTYREERCSSCDGTGRLKCMKCNGSGKQKKSNSCDTCAGKGVVDNYFLGN